jgi:pimeloyl-ACP methyl ester carboxylesterase
VIPEPQGPAAPSWFTRALAAASEPRWVAVEGVQVHYRVWGPVGAPGLVLVHGGGAHSGWWHHIAPQLVSHRVVALDLSGHGDSARRPAYDMRQWAREVVAVAGAESFERPTVVGHSMGGWVALTTGAEHPDATGAVAYIDSPLLDQPPEESRLAERRRPTRVYPTLTDALGHFRPVPEQETVLPYVAHHVARTSLRPVEGGWTWKFDPLAFGSPRPLLRDLLPQLPVPVALFRCEQGLVTPEMAAEMAGLASGHLPVVDVPDAGHHPMLDQPLALVTGLRTLLALWPNAAP